MALVGVPDARAGTLSVDVSAKGAAVSEAVASLHSAQALLQAKPGAAVIDQREVRFTPRVTVVTVGSQVTFPNSDNVRHQVYSFSSAKRFELPLYSGKRSEPVTFDKPGVVELGCNIHDWMLAYVVVEDTPYFATTDAKGRAVIVAPPGRYRLQVWHANQPVGTPAYETDVVVGDGTTARDVQLALTDRIAPPSPGDDKLRALQEKFRALKKAR